MTTKIKQKSNIMNTELKLRKIKSKLEFDMLTILDKYIIAAKPNDNNIVTLQKRGILDFTIEIMSYLEDYNKEHSFILTFQEKFVKINDVRAEEITFYIHTRSTNRTVSSLTLLPKLIEEI